MDNPPDFMAQWDYRDPAASALRFHALLPEARAAADLQYELELLTQIARTHSLQRQFAEAHQLLDEIEPRLTDATPQARLRALLERVRTFNSAGDKASAKTLFEQAWQLGLKHKELYLAIDAAHMIAIAAPLEEQSRWHQLAMELAERSTDQRCAAGSPPSTTTRAGPCSSWVVSMRPGASSKSVWPGTSSTTTWPRRLSPAGVWPACCGPKGSTNRRWPT